MIHKFLLIYSWLIRILTSFLPESTFSSKIRGRLYSLCLKSCGYNFQVSSGVIIQNLGKIEVGDNVYLAPGVVINAMGSVKFENEVMLGFNVVVVSGDHTKIGNSFRFGKSIYGDIIFKKGSWVGANSVILRDTIIEEGVLIGANSVIKGKTLPSHLYAGCPAKKIKII